MADMRKEGPSTRRASVPNSTTTTLGTAGVIEATATIAENADRALILVQNHGAVGERIRVSFGNDTNGGTRGAVLQGDANEAGSSVEIECTDAVWVYDMDGATPTYTVIESSYSGGGVS